MKIYLESGKDFVWQWDSKQRIVLDGYPAGVTVHYANCKMQEAPVVVSKMDGDKLVADIPPELMQEPHDITVYACDANSTRHCYFIHVIARPRPESYLYEPVEILRWETLDARLRKLENGDIIYEESDPTVPAWAKQPQKPTYTAQEVGALPAGTKIPAKTSDLTNDAGFITNAVNDLANYYTKTQTEDLIAQIPKFRISVVQQLPTVGEERVLYLVPFATAEGQYLEYIWVGGRFEIIGSQRVDLTGYATEEWVDGKLADKVSTADIIDNLTSSTAMDKPLSARQGWLLNFTIDTVGDMATETRLSLIEAKKTIPKKVSQLENDAGFLTEDDLNESIGDIDAALDRIIDIQNALIGGGS